MELIYIKYNILIIIIFLFLYLYNYKNNKINNNFLYNIISFFFFINIPFTLYYCYYSLLDFFSKSILCLCVCILFVVNNCLNSKLKIFYLQAIILYSFSVITFLFTMSNDLLIMFLCYELLMIPSIILIYKDSYSFRSYSAMLYFFLWTQAGSFLVLIAIIWLDKILLFNLYNYKYLSLYVDPFTLKMLKLFLFFGFGVKVPIFPFYRWLIQIHVEAPSGFSIFLSGFLVKTALFFYYKSSFFIIYSFEYLEIFMLFGILQSSLKFWFQTDLKKIIAYATVQEMNIIFLILNFIEQKYLYITIIFIISHGFLSSFMFYIVELIYRRFYTRNCYLVGNLWIDTPLLAKFIFLKILIFLGLPGFGKFSIEVIFYMFCFSMNFLLSFFFFIIINIIGIVGYSKIWINTLFTVTEDFKKDNIKINDLTTHEFLMCIMLCLSNISLNFLI